MLISVCMVAFNEEKTLSGILSDITAQSYPHSDTELLLIDNNSTDKTYDILCRFRDEHISEPESVNREGSAGWMCLVGLAIGVIEIEII